KRHNRSMLLRTAAKHQSDPAIWWDRPVWGRLSTCGRLAIAPLTLLRIFSPFTHFLFVSTFHRRRLPHYHSVGLPIFLTWRLHGSLPANRTFPSVMSSGRAFLTMDRILDHAVTGPLFLRR